MRAYLGLLEGAVCSEAEARTLGLLFVSALPPEPADGKTGL